MFKPLLSALVLPPLGPLLLALLGLFLIWRRRRGGITLTLLGLALLWVLSSHGTAVWLSRTVLTQYAPLAVTVKLERVIPRLEAFDTLATSAFTEIVREPFTAIARPVIVN